MEHRHQTLHHMAGQHDPLINPNLQTQSCTICRIMGATRTADVELKPLISIRLGRLPKVGPEVYPQTSNRVRLVVESPAWLQ